MFSCIVFSCGFLHLLWIFVFAFVLLACVCITCVCYAFVLLACGCASLCFVSLLPFLVFRCASLCFDGMVRCIALPLWWSLCCGGRCRRCVTVRGNGAVVRCRNAPCVCYLHYLFLCVIAVAFDALAFEGLPFAGLRLRVCICVCGFVKSGSQSQVR